MLRISNNNLTEIHCAVARRIETDDRSFELSIADINFESDKILPLDFFLALAYCTIKPPLLPTPWQILPFVRDTTSRMEEKQISARLSHG
jgi:hypothetical protein